MRSSSEAVGDLLVEGLEFHNGEVRIDGSECLAGDGFHVIHGPVGLDDDGASVEAGILLDGALACGLRYAPGHGDEVHGVVLPGRGVVCGVLDDADDLKVSGGLRPG